MWKNAFARAAMAMMALTLVVTMTWALQQGEGYEVHDMSRPQPAVVAPGDPGKPPADAIVLFGGTDLSQWSQADAADVSAAWKLEDGQLIIAPGSGDIRTRQQFADCQLHIEWMIPPDVAGKSQGRGNSGVFLMGLFELQIIDSYRNETYADGMAGSLYGQYPPLVNAARPPGEWQTYDVVFRAPRMDGGGKVVEPARMTVLFNGVLVQDNMDLLGPTRHKALTSYPDNLPTKGPITLQDHGNPVRFRNIWVRSLDEKPKAPVRSAGAGH